MSDVDRSVAAWSDTMQALFALGADFTTDDWNRQTECPEWTVKDVYAHLVGGEVWMSEGHPPPPTGLARIANEPVKARREVGGPEVLAELREVYALRTRQLAENPPDPDAPTMTAFLQPVTVGFLLRTRALDAWVHEQDVRRAVDRPGNLDTGGAEITRDLVVFSLPRVVVKRGGAQPGSSVRFTVNGPIAFDLAVIVDENGRGHLGAPPEAPTATLRLSWEDFSRLGAGRIPREAAAVEIHGDVALAERILADFSVTP